MSDWTKQTEQMMKTWNESQSKMLDTWFSSMQGMMGEDAIKNFDQERQKAMEAWQISVNKGIEAQEEWMRMWFGNMNEDNGTPKALADWAKQSQAMMTNWTESQKAFASSWFDMAHKMGGMVNSETWSKEGQKVMQVWQDAADKAVKAQMEMTRMLSEMGQKVGQ